MRIGELQLNTINDQKQINELAHKIKEKIKTTKILKTSGFTTSSRSDSYLSNGYIELESENENFCLIEKEITNIFKEFCGEGIIKMEYNDSYLIKKETLLGSKTELLKTILEIKYPKVTLFEEGNYTLRICGEMEVNFSKETLTILDRNEKALRTTHLEEHEFYKLYAKVLERKENV